jgi:hypothetical protein
LEDVAGLLLDADDGSELACFGLMIGRARGAVSNSMEVHISSAE